MLSQGRYWRAALSRGGGDVVLTVLRDALPDESSELAGLEIEVPLARWGDVLRHARLDRKLLGGVLLGLASDEDKLPRAIASDRLLGELQRVLTDATLTLVEGGHLRVGPVSADEDDAP